MAQQTKRKDGSKGGRGRNKSPTPKKNDQGSGKSRPEGMYEDYTLLDPGEISDTDEPDVVVDIPTVKVDEIHFELDDLEARISLHAEVLDLVKLSVGVHAELGKVKLDIKGVEAQALLRARLDHVTAIIDRVLTTLDRNPEVLKGIARTLEPVERLGKQLESGNQRLHGADLHDQLLGCCGMTDRGFNDRHMGITSFLFDRYQTDAPRGPRLTPSSTQPTYRPNF